MRHRTHRHSFQSHTRPWDLLRLRSFRSRGVSYPALPPLTMPLSAEPSSPGEACSGHDGWNCLPHDLLFKVGALLSGGGHTLSGMRGACSSWRDAAAGLEAELAPLGATPYLAAFPLVTSIDYARRGQGHTLRDEDLALVCAGSGGSLRSLDISGAFQLTAAGVGALAACQRLTRLRCTDATLLDSHVEALGGVASLEALSLSRCLFLRGDFFPALRPCTALRALDLAGCGLGLALNPGAVEALAALTTLTHLDLSGGNGVGDEVMAALARMPALRSLAVRGAVDLGDGGLHLLAAGPAAAQLHTLDLGACTRLSDAAWAALAGFPCLEELGLSGVPGLLRHLPLPEAMAGAAWRWGRLRRLDLGGSCVHPSKLKVLAATCGGTLEGLDIGDGGKRGVAYRRLTPAQLADLAAAARQLRALRRFGAAGAELPLGACLAFVRRAPGLLALDLSRCPLDDGSGPQAACPVAGWGPGLGLTSSRRRLDFDSFPAAAGVSLRSLMQQQAPAGPGASAEDFACALGRLSGLQSLKLAGCPGLGPAHLAHLSACTALMELSLAGAAGVGDAAAAAVAASAPGLASLDLAATQLSDTGLAALAGAASLAHLSIARNRGVTAAGLRAVAAGPAGRALRSLDASGCGGLGDEAAAVLAAGLPALHTLALSGNSLISAAGIEALSTLRHLRSLSLARCAAAVSDASLLCLASRLPGLTRLDISSCEALTQEGLAAALALLPCLADLDLTGSQGLRDDDVAPALPGLTRANVQMPGGARSPTGSPLRRRTPSQH